jgi:hypothetical protein
MGKLVLKIKNSAFLFIRMLLTQRTQHFSAVLRVVAFQLTVLASYNLGIIHYSSGKIESR